MTVIVFAELDAVVIDVVLTGLAYFVDSPAEC